MISSSSTPSFDDFDRKENEEKDDVLILNDDGQNEQNDHSVADKQLKASISQSKKMKNDQKEKKPNLEKVDELEKEQKKQEEKKNELANAIPPGFQMNSAEKFSIPQQNYWNSCADRLEITCGGLTVHHSGNGNWWLSAFAKCAIPSNNFGIVYFEIKFVHLKKSAAIGFATKAMPLDGRVGLYDNSYGYESNGTLWFNGAYQTGHATFKFFDVVGCGIILANRQLFFTKNGRCFDHTDLFVSSSSLVDPLFPCFSLHDNGDKILTNFGPNFEFDLNTLFC
ncbi:hypothetical protein niasHS_015703 [Heterodera schachtii]|uniref:B30.2/SPRY domain-containing protein n=1 Tax=Heterodera schachtii TaxID=97005 RepID=A0ABD2I785_HETSC